MRAKTIHEAINFERGVDPKKTMGIGLTGRINNLRNMTSVSDKQFDDDIIIHLFKKSYDNWKAKSGAITPKNLVIWKDSTYSGNPIIKLKAPGKRETTLLRGEGDFYMVSKEILDFLNTPEMKQEIADQLNGENEDTNQLSNLVMKKARREGIQFGSWNYADTVAKRLIDLLQ